MRGDSLRDLYAKALALFGLAALAAIGALFDYWPVSNDLPRLVHRGLPVVTPQMPSVPDLTAVQLSSPAPVRPAGRRDGAQPHRASGVTTATPVTAALGLAMANASPFDARQFGTSVALMPPPAGTMSDAAPFRLQLPAGNDGAWIETLPQHVEMFPAPAGSDNGSAVSFVTDALKKTGDTIVRTGVKTGASIRDAIVSFGGAFRKLL